jgi:hypothetical protein
MLMLPHLAAEDTGPKEVRHERIEDIGEPIVEEEADLIRKM